MLEQFQRTRLELIGLLGELCSLGRETGAKGLAARLDQDVVQKLENDRFHLVVVGEFNHGKTTFVNALLGASVLPTGVTPTTAVIHHLIHAETPRARVVYERERNEQLSFDEVRRFAAGADRAGDPVRHLEIGYPAEILAERVVLVDTPGVNDLSLTRAEITYEYIPRSDALLFVLDAGQPLKESERQFLEHQLIGRSRNKIVFVVAKADLWSDAEREEALEYIRARLGGLVDDPAVFPIRAQAALAGRRDESGIPELVRHLEQLLSEQRGAILLSNALGEGLAATRLLGRTLDARRRAAALDDDRLERRIELLKQELRGSSETLEKRRLMIREETAAIKAWARRDLDRFCDDVERQLPQVVENASADDLKRHLGAFLESSFRGWAEAETKEVAASLEQLAERTLALVRQDAKELGQKLSDSAGQDLKTATIEVDTFAYDVGVFAVLSVGLGVVFANALLGGVLLAAAPALALWNRDRTTAQVRQRALELVPTILRDAAAKMAPKLDQMIDEFSDALDSWVVVASQELHRDVVEVLEHVRAERETGSRDAAAQLELVDRVRNKCVEIEERLNALTASGLRRDADREIGLLGAASEGTAN